MCPSQHDTSAVHVAAHQQAECDSVLSFWFDRPEPLKTWFGGSPQFDQAIATQFGPLMAAAAQGALDGWRDSPRGALALLILLDQFPRNIYRGKAQAFATDSRALQAAVAAIAQGFDRQVPWLQQAFFYLPLEHDESLQSQVASVALFEGLVARRPAEQEQLAQTFLGFALRHRDTIRTFGRFPGRNGALGRTPSAAEVAHLEAHPMGF